MTFCRENNLTVLANSDMHGVVSEEYPNQTNRPMTIVFARERTHDAIKEALFAGRTLAYFNDMIAGREEFARPFFYQCISIGKTYYTSEKNKYFEIRNNSDIPFILENGIPGTPQSVTLKANSITRMEVSNKVTAPLTYDVKNVITGENEVLKIELK